MQNTIKRLLCLALTVMMVLSLVPAAVFAADTAVDAVAVNTTTGAQYENLTDALLEAADGQTVQLKKDVEDTMTTVFENVTLDLNGNTLTTQYMTCFGDLVDTSADNAGLLQVADSRFMLQESNTQLPVKTAEGYSFAQLDGFNVAMPNASKYVFQPKFEAASHEALAQGSEATGVSVEVFVTWKQGDGIRAQRFAFNDSHLQGFLASYKPATGKFGRQFALTLMGAENFEELSFSARIVSTTGVIFDADPSQMKPEGSVDVNENGELVGDMTLESAHGTAFVPAGTKLAEGTKVLKLTTTPMASSGSGLELDESQEMTSLDVHIEGIAAGNTVPVIVTLNKVAPEFLNQGNIALYHVENGETVAMTRVFSAEEVDAHNEYYYDIATGALTMAMASFSEVAVVSKAAVWEGGVDYSWYTDAVAPLSGESTVYKIYNADQLAGLSAIVGGMDGQTQDSFAGKTVMLMADIDFDDGEKDNDPNKIFYPIGYYNSDGTYVKTNKAITSGFYTFQGTFDGNGNTISNIYQNTWEMKGDHNWYDATLQYYRDGMGLFGKVYGGTVKNLTIDNFISDGEIATTGCVAAYADFGATFENITITNCNPRVYNIGNGGIVGCVGWYAKEVTDKQVTFRNITVDASNKISALWGSYDVACGGIVGQYYPTSGQSSYNYPVNAGIHFENCHVAAVLDVNNDVCANYQYYAYRYSGMLVGSVRENVTIDGRVYPQMEGITAENCTVKYGDWVNYYYCELVANSLASYTHDHQFSRLTGIASLNEIKDGDTWLTTGNFILVDKNGLAVKDADGNTTCYHIMKDADGNLYQHFHEASGYEDVDVNGDGTKEHVLKEDRQRYYLPFTNQLVTGYGWGVTSKGIEDFAGTESKIQIAEGEYDTSVSKFASTGTIELVPGKEYTIGQLFNAINTNVVDVVHKNVQVFVSPVVDAAGNAVSDVSGTYKADTSDWTKGTLTLSGTGAATITITDYFFCTPTTVQVALNKQAASVAEAPVANELTYNGTAQALVSGGAANGGKLVYSVDGTNYSTEIPTRTNAGTYTVFYKVQGDAGYTDSAVQAVDVTVAELDAFKILFPNVDKYLYRVGNNNPVELKYLFSVGDYANIVGNVTVTAVSKISGETVATASGKPLSTATLTFNTNFTGPVEITISSDNCVSKTLYVEVVDAKNIVAAEGTTTGVNFVLLTNIKGNSQYYYWNSTVYGNGFTYDITGAPHAYSGSHGHGVFNANNARFDNLVIIGAVYEAYNPYTNHISLGANYYNAAINAEGNTIIENCYIANCAAPVRASGNITITNTTLYGGTVANLIISGGTNTLNNVTTINYNDEERDIIGFGIVVSDGANENTEIVLNGTLKQHNYVCKADIEDVPGEEAQSVFNSMFSETFAAYHIGNPIYVNTGIVFLTEKLNTKIITDNANTGYQKLDDAKVKVQSSAMGATTTVNGALYSTPSTGTVDNNYVQAEQVQGVYEPTFEFSLGAQGISYEGQGDDRFLYYTEDVGVKAAYTTGTNAITLDLNALNESVTRTKYGVALNATVICKDPSGNAMVATNGVVTLDSNGTYMLEFSLTDNQIYDQNGNRTDRTAKWVYTVPVDMSVYEPTVADATMTISSAALTGDYISSGTNKKYKMYPLKAITSIMDDANKDGVLETFDFKKNIQSAVLTPEGNNAFSSPTTITITYTGGQVLTIVLGTPSGLSSPGASNGGKTFSVKTDSTNGIYLQSDGAIASSSAATGTWPLTSWKFKGTSGKEITDSTKVIINFTKPSCVTGDAMITLADGSQKRVDQLTQDDILLAWDFETGTYAAAPAGILECHGSDLYRVLYLRFSDGTEVKVIEDHGLFDTSVNNFVYISEYNAEDYLGHSFVKADGDGYTTVTLQSYEVIEEYNTAWTIQTAVYNNNIIGGMFSLNTPDFEGWLDYFDITEEMVYDQAHKQAEIEKYGLADYAEYEHLVTYEQFVAFNGQYLNILLGRGVLTMDDLEWLISEYLR